MSDLYYAIEKGIPPATELPIQGDIPDAIKRLWGVLEQCWNIDPEKRPSAPNVQEFVTRNRDDLEAAFCDGSFDAKLVHVKSGV
jgi:hypothetical protein